eukprot:evm.model.scf_241.3 EVM.evm.TU.scf_241.3   scf_241:44357-45814(-)
MGSSGLWDLINWEEAALVSRRVSNKDAAARIVTLAMIQNNWTIRLDTSVLVVDVLPPNEGDFPKLVKQKLKRRRAREHRGARLLRLFRRTSLGSRSSRADLHCDDPQIVANIDGWMLLKAALEATLNDSCSSLMELTCFLLADECGNAVDCEETQLEPWDASRDTCSGRRGNAGKGRGVQMPRFSEDSRRPPTSATSSEDRPSSRATFDSARSGPCILEYRQTAEPGSPAGSCSSRQSFGEGSMKGIGQTPDTESRHSFSSGCPLGNRGPDYSTELACRAIACDEGIDGDGLTQLPSFRHGSRCPLQLTTGMEVPTRKGQSLVRKVPFTMHPAQDHITYSWTSAKHTIDETTVGDPPLCPWQLGQVAETHPGSGGHAARLVPPQVMSPAGESLVEKSPQEIYPAQTDLLGGTQAQAAPRVPFTMIPARDLEKTKSKVDGMLGEDSWEFYPKAQSLEMMTPRPIGSLDGKFMWSDMRTLISRAPWS